MTTDETTSHSAMPPENGGQAADYSHLTKLANYANQVIGYSPSTDKTTSHLTRLANDASQVIDYRLSAEELLAGHPKDDNQVHPQGVRRGCKGLKAPTTHAGWLC
jgi:hypothetical protein